MRVRLVSNNLVNRKGIFIYWNKLKVKYAYGFYDFCFYCREGGIIEIE